jgi:hypothetical protein
MSEFIIYTSEDGKTKIDLHLKNIFSDDELEENSVIRKFRITAQDGKSYTTNHYNLSRIIAIGYKVNSERAMQFRKWATQTPEEMTKQHNHT